MIGMALSAIPAIIGGAQAISGMIQAKNNKRPEYNIPKEVTQALNVSQNALNAEYAPGQVNAQNNLQMSQVNALAAANDGNAGGNANIAAIQATTDRGYENLFASANQWRDSQRSAVINGLNNMADFKDKQWQLNKLDPYVDKYNSSREMVGAGMQNIMGAANNIGSMMMKKQQLSSMLGQSAQNMSMKSGITSAINGVSSNMASQVMAGGGALGAQAGNDAALMQQIMDMIKNMPK